MTPAAWFSTKLRFGILVEDYGGDMLNECVFVFKAAHFDAAFDRALAIGKQAEKSYVNGAGKRAIWKFMTIVSLDIIAAENLDGAEVYSEPVHLSADKMLPFDSQFRPEDSKPTQTL